MTRFSVIALLLPAATTAVVRERSASESTEVFVSGTDGTDSHARVKSPWLDAR